MVCEGDCVREGVCEGVGDGVLVDEGVPDPDWDWEADCVKLGL